MLLLEARDIVAAQWDELVAGKSVDPARVRPEIFRSWIKCREQGVDPFTEIIPSSDVDGLLARSRELVAAAQPFMEMVNEVIAGSGLRIDCIDHDGYFLIACGDATLVRESQFNGLVAGCCVAVSSIGTNAAGLCLALERPVQVLGPEHYNTHLHNLNCSATPIHAPGGELVGALNILSYATPQNRQTLGLTTSIAKTIENQLALSRTITSLKVSNAKLNTIMEYLPQGVISLDRAGRVGKLKCPCP